jgi:hypothetical protein
MAAKITLRSADVTHIFKVAQLPDSSSVFLSLQLQNKNAPRVSWGNQRSSLPHGVSQTAAWEGSLAYGLSADYSGGTAADFHGLPRCPCLKIVN